MTFMKTMRQRNAGKGFTTIAGFVMVLLALGGYIFLSRMQASAAYHCEQGKLYLSKGQLSKAIEKLEQSVDIDSEFQDAKVLLGKAYYKKGISSRDLAAREDLLRNASLMTGGKSELPISRKLSETYFAMAKANTRATRKIELLVKSLQFAPDENVLDILKLMKTASDEIGDYTDVMKTVNNYYEKMQTSELRQLLIDCSISASEAAITVHDKVSLLEDARKLDLTNTGIGQQLALAKVEMASTVSSSFKAITLCEEALKLDTECRPAREKLAELYLAEAQKAATSTLKDGWRQKAKRVLPNYKEVLKAISARKSTAASKTTAASSPEPESAETPPKVAEPVEPVIHVEPVVTVKPVKPMSLDKIAVLKDAGERVKQLEVALGHKPQAKGFVMLAEAYEEMRFKTLERVLEMNPDHRESRKILSETYFQRGLAAGSVDEKMMWYERAAQCNPAYVNAFHNLGVLLEKKKRYDDAIKRYEQAIKADSSFASSYLRLGVLYYQKRSDPGKAADCFRTYLKLDPNSGTARKVAKQLKALEKMIK